MKHMWIAGLALLASTAATEAFALSVAVDAPLSYTLNSATFTANGGTVNRAAADSVSGYKIAIKLPFFIGLGYEDYKAGFSISLANLPPGVAAMNFLGAFKIYDLFVELPIPFIHIGLGVGVGEAKGETDPPLGAVSKSAAITQYFATLGLPLGMLLDVHVGYHVVNVADIDFTIPGGTSDKVLLSGNMLSAGIRLGF